MSNIIDGNGRPKDLGIMGSRKGSPAKIDSTGSKTGSDSTSESATVVDVAIASDRRVAIESRIAQTPNVDMPRVDRIKQAISRGEYPIDEDRIAEKFVEFEGLLDRNS